MNIFFFLISNVSNVMILKYYFNWNYSLSDIRYRLKKKKIWPIFLVNLTIRVRVKGQNSRLDANKGGKRGRRNERKRDEKKKKGSLKPVEQRGMKPLLILMVDELCRSPSLKFQVTRLMDIRFARGYSRPCNWV